MISKIAMPNDNATERALGIASVFAVLGSRLSVSPTL